MTSTSKRVRAVGLALLISLTNLMVSAQIQVFKTAGGRTIVYSPPIGPGGSGRILVRKPVEPPPPVSSRQRDIWSTPAVPSFAGLGPDECDYSGLIGATSISPREERMTPPPTRRGSNRRK